MKYVVEKGILYPELSFQIVGSAFDVFNELGPGLRERTYERAFSVALTNRGIVWKEQVYVPIKFASETVGTHYLDFLVENCIIVELKCRDYISRQEINQAVQYLQATGHQLAILILFTQNGVRQKRIVHPDLLKDK